MSHAVHQLPRRVFGDDCEECVYRAKNGIDGLLQLDPDHLGELFKLAAEMSTLEEIPDDASEADVIAVRSLQRAAMVFDRAGANAIDIRFLAKG